MAEALALPKKTYPGSGKKNRLLPTLDLKKEDRTTQEEQQVIERRGPRDGVTGGGETTLSEPVQAGARKNAHRGIRVGILSFIPGQLGKRRRYYRRPGPASWKAKHCRTAKTDRFRCCPIAWGSLGLGRDNG